jgi:integrase
MGCGEDAVRYTDGTHPVAIHAELPEYLKDFFEFAYLCGARKQQLAGTTWAHWDPEAREFAWDAAEVKAKVPHVLQLDGRPLELVQARYAQRTLHGRHVFHGPYCAPGRRPAARPASPAAGSTAATCSTTPATPPLRTS